jgi:hypothetical protein
VVALRYRFRQPFRAPAREAFAWCTDYTSEDGGLFAVRTRRKVRWLAEDTCLMSDTTWPQGHARTITRLVRIDPSRLSWTNTHLNGPFRYSQFWYRVVPDGKARSHLEFTGLHLDLHATPLSARETARQAEAHRRSDGGEWRTRLAPALEADCNPVLTARARRRGRPGSRSGGASHRTS